MVHVAGVDIGAAFSKVVVFDGNKVISYYIAPSSGSYRDTAEKVVAEALAKVGLSAGDIAFTMATGYGAANVAARDGVASNISCQGRGASYLFPSVRTVIDVGGQLTKVLKLDDEGRVRAFLQSERCAAGSGKVLQVIARVLQVDLEEIGALSLKSRKRIDFNTGCAVFAETEAVSRVAEGAAKEDILAGLHRALAAKIQTLVERVRLEPDCALVGGAARDTGLVRSIEEIMGLKLLVPEEPRIVAALGAALIAEEKVASTMKINIG
ncbi:MAG: acyl-CoA dehydratase activase [Chloroflexota bacterium]|nr:acyl-CoA dehydratase activase [Chloroflexota bacterium]